MYLPHDLLVAKSEAYGVDKNGLNLIRNYLTNRKRRTKISSSYIDWCIARSIPRSSILRSLFFNLFINDLFLFVEKQIYAISLMVVQYIAIISICKLF